jgi:hypothetical protein
MKRETIRIERDVLLKIDRKARRDAEIEFGVPRFKNKVHKDKKKDYNRQAFKRELKTFY